MVPVLYFICCYRVDSKFYKSHRRKARPEEKIIQVDNKNKVKKTKQSETTKTKQIERKKKQGREDKKNPRGQTKQNREKKQNTPGPGAPSI